MRRFHAWLVVAAVVVTAIVVSTGGIAAAQAETRHERVITVRGTGLVTGTPDVLELTLGVDTRGKSAGDALAENSKLTLEVLKVLRVAGVADEDIQTSDLSIQPVYDEDGETVIAYSAGNHVTAELHDLDKAGRVVDAATEAAGDQIVVQGLYFEIDDNSQLVARARAEAVKRAKAQAQQLADAAGVQLGELQSISEESAPVGPVLEREKAAASPSSGDAAPPIEPGSQTLTVDVTLIYAIA
ncbi:MAG TPA: SIMPL domain-containing protein [Acidimicrobiia bacterium]|jgi:hypothetical protein